MCIRDRKAGIADADMALREDETVAVRPSGVCLLYTSGGKCNLRLDDTNPTKEDTEYVDAILEDIKWLGFQWEHLYYASDYFCLLYTSNTMPNFSALIF